MFEYGLCTENYNPDLLFAFQGVVDGTEKHYDFKYHCHDFLELSIVTSGKLEYYIDGNEYILKKRRSINYLIQDCIIWKHQMKDRNILNYI